HVQTACAAMQRSRHLRAAQELVDHLAGPVGRHDELDVANQVLTAPERAGRLGPLHAGCLAQLLQDRFGDRDRAPERNARDVRAERRQRSGDCRFDCRVRSEEHTSELQSQSNLVCRLLLEKKKNTECRMQNAECRMQNTESVLSKITVKASFANLDSEV